MKSLPPVTLGLRAIYPHAAETARSSDCLLHTAVTAHVIAHNRAVWLKLRYRMLQRLHTAVTARLHAAVVASRRDCKQH